jgi:hypothetical protein
MKFFLLLFLLIAIKSNSQDSTCRCSYKVNPPKYPKKAEQNNICGTLIIEIDQLEDGTWANPVLKQGLGYGCDEEALRFTRVWISLHNRCVLKCQFKNYKKSKFTQPVTFVCPDKEE